MKINIYGSGLSAWVAAACLAKVGNNVMIDEALNGATQELIDIPVVRDEPDLLGQLQVQIKQGRLTRLLQAPAPSADIHWLAMQPTEQRLAEQVVARLKHSEMGHQLVVNQCNFEVGATAALQAEFGGDNDVVYMPDNLQEGLALQGFYQPKRVILGADNESALIKIKAILKPFSQSLDVWQVMSSREAEFTKFAITGMLALRLGYINELANLAEQLGVDISVVQEGMGADPRVGPHYLSAGCGFGGQNFDAYVSTFSDILQKEQRQPLLKTVVEENEVQKELLFRKLWQHYGGDLQGKRVGIWGASFKPGTARIDNAPSLKIIDALVSQGVHVQVHDPEALNNLRQHYGKHALIQYMDSPMAAAKGVDALLVVTEWPLYWSPDYSALLAAMRRPLIIDGRNIFDRATMQQFGFNYLGVGR